MNRKYKDKFIMWEVGDAPEDEIKLGEYETFQEFLEHLPSYYKNANMTYTFGCLSWLGQISHVELRFKKTPMYNPRRDWWNK